MEPRALTVGAKVTDPECPGLTMRRLRHSTIFEWRGRVNGSKVSLRLGVWPKLSLERARTLAERARAIAAAGGDPRGRRPSGPTTTGAALEQYEREHLAFRRKGRTVAQALRRHLGPVLSWPIETVGRAELKAAVEPFIAERRWSSAHTARARLWAFMNWCEGEELVERAPGRMRLAVAAPKRGHVPSVADCRLLFDGARALRARHRAFVRVLLLGGLRRGEAASFVSDDVRGSLIVIPASRTKQAREHVLPITPALGAELPFLVGARSLGGFSRIKGKLVAASGVHGWCFHDFRRALRSHLRDAGVDRDVLERILGHVVGGAEGHYDYATLLPQMRTALELWEEMVTYPPQG